jgi:hypothetical protein
MTTTTSLIPAEIVLTAIEGKVYAHVNGEQVTETKNSNGFIGRIEKALRAAHIYRQTGYVTEAGAMIAEGQRVVA